MGLEEYANYDVLRHVVPGAYGVLYCVVFLHSVAVISWPVLSAEWLVVILLGAFLLGYLFHLAGIRYTNHLIRVAPAQSRHKKDGKTWNPRMEGHHTQLALSSTAGWFLRPEVRARVLEKLNDVSGLGLTQEQLDKEPEGERLRWTAYHACYAYVMKNGFGDEVRSSCSQFELVRGFHMALWFGFALAVASLLALAMVALSDPAALVEHHGLDLVAAVLGTVLAPLAHRALREQQVKASLRLAGATYEAFLVA